MQNMENNTHREKQLHWKNRMAIAVINCVCVCVCMPYYIKCLPHWFCIHFLVCDESKSFTFKLPGSTRIFICCRFYLSTGISCRLDAYKCHDLQNILIHKNPKAPIEIQTMLFGEMRWCYRRHFWIRWFQINEWIHKSYLIPIQILFHKSVANCVYVCLCVS